MKSRLLTSDGIEERLYHGNLTLLDGERESLWIGNMRVIWDDQDKPLFQHKISDHLGNTMVTFEDKNEDGSIDSESAENGQPSEIISRHQYYAFGMEMDGLWSNDDVNKIRYTYNGKEEIHKDYLGLLDYGFRFYDPAIARFTTVDPLAEEFTFQSGYVYAGNNPISNIDFMGLSADNVIINGADADKATKELNNSSSLNITRDSKTGQLSATGTANSASDKKLLSAINDKNNHVVLTATKNKIFTDKTGNKSYLAPGGYGGSTVSTKTELSSSTIMGKINQISVPEISTVTEVTGTQSINMSAAAIVAGEIGESVGETVAHEINEAYIGTFVDPGGNYTTGYTKSHNAAAKLDAHSSNHTSIVRMPGGVGIKNTKTNKTKRIH